MDAGDVAVAVSEGNATRCKILPVAGSRTTSSRVNPAVTSSLPFGLNASALSRMPGSSTCVPAGVTIWLTGVMSESPLRPTGAVVESNSPAKIFAAKNPADASAARRLKHFRFIPVMMK